MGEIIYIHNYGGDHKVATVFDVANYFISKASLDADSGSVMTHLKLQKLCYYAQAWSLAIYDTPLFQNEFEAWQHGPVCRELWDQLKDYKYNPILEEIESNNIAFSEEEFDILNQVWDIYGDLGAKTLENLTHSEEPWKVAWKDRPYGSMCNEVIPKSLMKAYYASQLKSE